MTKALKHWLERAADWPRELREEATDALRAIDAAHRGTYKLTEEDRAALRRSAEDVRLKRFVSKKKLRAFFRTGRA